MSFEVEPNAGFSSLFHPGQAGLGLNPFDASAFPHPLAAFGPGLGREYLMSDSGALSPVSHAHGAGGGAVTTTGTAALSPTLAGSSTGLQFDLVWDSSVASAPSGFQSAVIGAAQIGRAPCRE